MASYSSDTLPTCIEYHSADLYDTYTMYNPADICWDVLSDIMSLYYLHIYRIFGLNGVEGDCCKFVQIWDNSGAHVAKLRQQLHEACDFDNPVIIVIGALRARRL